jgi:surfactin synthase thioesterase subunit
MTAQQRDNPWLPFGLGGSGTRLFCFPFAGGGASSFVAWRRSLTGIALAPIQYPGRETRIDESCVSDLSLLIDGIVSAIARHLEEPYAILGYSLGAKIAFALCHRLLEQGLKLPRTLHVVAHRQPGAPTPRPGAFRLPEAEFRQHIQSYGGTPDEIFDSSELAALLLPILRADFTLVECPVAEAPLPIPIFAYAGTNDPVVQPEQMVHWAGYSTAGFHLRQFTGGHFFTRNTPDFFTALAHDLIDDRKMKSAQLSDKS